MKKLFTSSALFGAAFLLTFVSLLALLVTDAVKGNGSFFQFRWFVVDIFLACEITMFVSYLNHNKNLMKGMMGATLMAVVMNGFSAATAAQGSANVVCGSLCTLLSVFLLIMHFFINSDRRASPNSVRINSAACVAFALLRVIWFIVDVSGGETFFNSLCYALSDMGIVATVVCIEARLDAFRTDREVAGWTEKQGYPQGYVRQHQRH